MFSSSLCKIYHLWHSVEQPQHTCERKLKRLGSPSDTHSTLTYLVGEKRTVKMNRVARDGQHLDAALPVDVVHSDLPQHRQPQGPEMKKRKFQRDS